MPDGWTTSNRRNELPPNWTSEIVPFVKERDGHRCRWGNRQYRCPHPGTEVDHIRDRHNHSPANLQLLCGYHHKLKTAAEAAAARREQAAKLVIPTGKHPGMR